MKVALFWPPFDTTYTIPLPLGFLKSNLPEGEHEVRLFDCALRATTGDSDEARTFLREFRPDVVGVSSWSSMARSVAPILRAAKLENPGVITVVGGPHATAYTSRVMAEPDTDFVFRGEAETSFPAFLRQLQSGKPDYSSVEGLVWRGPDGQVRMNEMVRHKDLDLIKPPDYSFMDLEGYLARGYRLHCPEPRNAPILATRGCPYRCAFCTAPIMNGTLVRKHSIPYLTALIRKLYDGHGIRWFNLVDDNFTFDTVFARAFCEAVIAMKLKGAGFGTPNGIRMQKGDPELWRLMKRAGWKSVVIAPESGSPATLARMRKDFDLSVLPRVVREMKEAGLVVQAFFIIGYPGETRADLEMTLKTARDTGFDFFYLNNFTPLPGTPVYDELVAAGEIADGLLPAAFSDGVRTYTPATLKGVNFPLIVLRAYAGLAVRHPLRFLRMLKFFNLRLILIKLLLNIARSLGLLRKQAPAGRHMQG